MENNMLTWEEVVADFENLIKYAAKQTFQQRTNIDNAVGVGDLYQIGLIKLYECWEKYAHLPKGEFKAIFCTALFRSVRRSAKFSGTVDFEEAIAGDEGYEDDYMAKLEFKEGLEQLKNILESPVAIAILNEMIAPSPRTLFEVWADAARKYQLKVKQGKNVRLSKQNEVKNKHIRAALQITQKQFDDGIAEIREKAGYAFAMTF